MSHWIIFYHISCIIFTHLWDRFGHRITSSFSQLLRRMLESGLVDIYRRRTLRRMKLADADHRHHHAAAARMRLREDETPVKPIVLENLLAVFALYSATTAVAVVAFLVVMVGAALNVSQSEPQSQQHHEESHRPEVAAR